MSMTYEKETLAVKWQQELDLFSAFKSLFVLDGNINDYQIYAGDGRTRMSDMTTYLYEHLHELGYHAVIFHDPLSGFFSPTKMGKTDLKLFDQMMIEQDGQIQKTVDLQADLRNAADLLPRAMAITGHPLALVFNLQSLDSSSIANSNHLNETLRHFYSQVFRASRISQAGHEKPNLLFIIASRISDVPSWVYSQNPFCKVLALPLPDSRTRRVYLESQMKSFLPRVNPAQDVEALKDLFVNATEGLSLIDIDNLTKLMAEKKWRLEDVRKAVSLYKYGVKDNPWTDFDLLKRLPHLEEDLRKRVKGQDTALRQASDILTRSILGLSGIQHSGSDSKPKGVLFLAGPTGVGKTELAKALAEWLFGSDEACIRFDMSEYQLRQSDQRLLGAPPGYVGYDEGGQLTNAVKEHPFSVLLFDEIEKANVSVLDKFLQILEDGRMTDGRGETVYFSDCLIIFTSNLGVYQRNTETGISELKVPMPRTEEEIRNFSYESYRRNVMNVIRGFFLNDIGRPELLNRIGENFLIFRYITHDAAVEILKGQISKIQSALIQSRHLQLEISDKAMGKLVEDIDAHLDNGGRGVGNSLEKNLLNPLARVLAKLLFASSTPVSKLIIEDIDIRDEETLLVYSK